MKKLIYRFLIAATTTFPFDLSAQEFKTTNGNVEFLSKASFNEFTGTSDHLNGLMDLTKKTFDFYLDLNTLKTGIGLRDRHMRENYLETKKYPFAEFSGMIQEPFTLQIGESREVTAKGKFKIHGVEKNISVPGKLTAVSDSELRLEAEFKLMLTDFNISIPSVMFYELSEEQVVTINSLLKKK